MPAIQEHFDFIHNASYKAFEAIVKSFGYNAPGYILFGCNYTENASSYTINPGAIVLDGEILVVDGHTVSKQSGVSYFWYVDETDDPEGTMQFFDGNTYNVYAKRRGVVAAQVPPAGSYMYLGQEPRLPDLIHNLIGNNYVSNSPLSWISPTMLNGWTHNLSSGKQGLLYTKQANGIVKLIGHILPTNATGFVITQLPQGYRPAFTAQSNWVDLNGKLVTIETSGDVKINNYSTSDVNGYYIQAEFPTI